MGINYPALNTVVKNIKEISPHTSLIIVSKNRSYEDIDELLSNNYSEFGENRVQEAQSKFSSLRDKYQFKLHMLGPLQSNKIELALQIFDTIQSIDRIKIVRSIESFLKKKDLPIRTKNFFIQVNIGNEPQKSGIKIEDCKDFYLFCKDIINIQGLMCIPPLNDNPTRYFDQLIELKKKINNNLKISMGMSADYLEALNKKANFIRVGSKLFI